MRSKEVQKIKDRKELKKDRVECIQGILQELRGVLFVEVWGFLNFPQSPCKQSFSQVHILKYADSIDGAIFCGQVNSGVSKLSKTWPKLLLCVSSSEEVGLVGSISVDVNHKVGQALSSIHHVLLEGCQSLSLVLLRGDLSSGEVYIKYESKSRVRYLFSICAFICCYQIRHLKGKK